MKVQVAKLLVTTVDVEMPESCPICGSTIVRGGNIVADNVMIEQYVHFGGRPSASPVGAIVVGYRCGCGTALVETASSVEHVDDDHFARGLVNMLEEM